MLPERIQQQRLRCVEDIALLSLLRPSPTCANENPWPVAVSVEDPARLLSREAELNLSRVLAFLSSISDDPAHVVAVCLEELANGNGVRVVVAINKQSPAAADDVLHRIKVGLEVILGHLARAVKGVS